MSEMTLRTRAAVLLVPALLALGACDGDGPTEPRLDNSDVAGTYAMTELAFDPQGILPVVDVLAELDEAPTLNLTLAGQAQIIMRDPVTSLIVTINGSYQTTTTGVRIDFPETSEFEELLLPAQLNLTFNENAGTLSFNGTAAGGVSRDRLVELVPSLEDEQLLDPTPGVLAVEFTMIS